MLRYAAHRIDSLGLEKTQSELDLVVEDTGLNPMLDVCTEEAFNKLLSFGMEKPPYIPGVFMDLLVTKKCGRSKIEKIVYSEMIQDSNLNQMVRNITVPTIIIWGKKIECYMLIMHNYFIKKLEAVSLLFLKDLGAYRCWKLPKKLLM